MSNMPEFEEDRYLGGATTNDKIKPCALSPIHIIDRRVGMLSLKMFSFRIITHTFGIPNEYFSIPSEFMMISYHLLWNK